MRVADAIKATSFVRRLRVGDKFSDVDGQWEVVRNPEVINGDGVKIYVLPFPHHDGQRARAYNYDMDARVDMIRK